MVRTVTATVALSPTQLGAGHHLIHWVGRSGPLGVTSAYIGADLTLHPEAVSLNGNQINASVANQGNLPSQGGTLEVYDRDPSTAGAQPVAQFPIPPLAPGAYADVGGAVGLAAVAGPSQGTPALYLRLKPHAGDPDYTPYNNVVPIGNHAGSAPPLSPGIYLPAISR